MKTKFFILVFLLFLIYFFTISAFAQTAPGGGSGCATSISVKRNNGNGHGVCSGDAQLRVIFNPMPLPENIPLLTAIYYQGQLSTKVSLPVVGDIVTEGQGYVSYCVSAPLKNNGNQFGIISRSVKISVEFTYTDGTVCRTDVVN
jgi:hypothetical protein